MPSGLLETNHKLNQLNRNIRSFFSSQDFSDGLRITFGILIPSVIAAHFNHFEIGLTLSLGALCVSITDAPGPVRYKRNGMLLCNALIFVVAVITGFARLNVYTLGLEILLFSFLFSMFTVYGTRAAALGSAALIIVILMMDQALAASQVLGYSALILGGGLWYMLLSLLFSQFRPYRPAQRLLGSCIQETAQFLRLKAEFYSQKTDLDEDYRQLVAQQIVVNEKQDAVREMLFKTREIVNDSTSTGRLLVLTFVDSVDLFEHIMATYYDYGSLRERFGSTGILDDISEVIKKMATELENIGFAIQANVAYKNPLRLTNELEQLRSRIDALTSPGNEENTLVLKKILVNLRNLNQRLTDMLHYFEVKPADPHRVQGTEYSKFVSHQNFDFKIFRENLTLNSSVFRHAVRMLIACLVGFTAAKILAYGHHSYWILLTITVILKPGFSLTKQRNFQRLAGTLVGGIIGVVILILVEDKTAKFIILLLFMLGAYSFQRKNYIVMVILMTPYLLILFSLLGIGFLNIAQERVLDTLMGSVIALATSYLVFPSWESAQHKNYLQNTLKANANYLKQLSDALSGKPFNLINYKLARKEVYVTSANLSAAFQRMLSEPKSKQRNKKEVHQFVVLSHILASNIATIAAAVMARQNHAYPEDILRLVRRSVAMLQEGEQKFGLPAATVSEELPSVHTKTTKASFTADELLLKEQLEFILKLCTDLNKITDAILNLHQENGTEKKGIIAA